MKLLQKIMMVGVLILTQLCHMHADQQLSEQDTIALHLIGAMQESIKLNGQLQLQLATLEIAAQANNLKAQFAGFLDGYLTQFGQVYEKQSGLMNAYRNVYLIASKDNQDLAITPNEYQLLLKVLQQAAQSSDWRSTINLELSVRKNDLIVKKDLKLHEIISAIEQVPLPTNYSMTNILAGAAALAAIGAGTWIAYNLATDQNYQVFGYNPFIRSAVATKNLAVGNAGQQNDLKNSIEVKSQDDVSQIAQVHVSGVMPVIGAAQREQVGSADQLGQATELISSLPIKDPSVVGNKSKLVHVENAGDEQMQEMQHNQDAQVKQEQNNQNQKFEQRKDAQGDVKTDVQTLDNFADNSQARSRADKLESSQINTSTPFFDGTDHKTHLTGQAAIDQLRRTGVCHYCDFKDVDLRSAIGLHKTIDVQGSTLSNVNMSGARLSSLNVSKCRINGLKAAGAKILNLDAQEADWRESFLRRDGFFDRTDMRGAVIQMLNLRKAYINKANFSGVTIDTADISRTSGWFYINNFPSNPGTVKKFTGIYSSIWYWSPFNSQYNKETNDYTIKDDFGVSL